MEMGKQEKLREEKEKGEGKGRDREESTRRGNLEIEN